MSDEYILVRDIIYDHNARMMNIKKYYPYFKLCESDFSSYQGGKFKELDMGYILMAVIRYFIEENSFKEQDVTYEGYEKFISNLYRRDFNLTLTKNEEKELSLFIFDKIRNDGKPFIYKYYDPQEKVKKTVRMRIIDSTIKAEMITYHITSEAIEFYLDTKEIKDESTISIAQVLLGKLIESRNFKGGTEVIRRINNEVARLKLRKNEILFMLGENVFEGIKAYEEFVDTVVKWFDDEQKLFAKNMELIHHAMERMGNEEVKAAKDIYELETELKKSIKRHAELLNSCTELGLQADRVVSESKFSRLRRSFDFSDGLKTAMDNGRADVLMELIMPVLKLNIRKTFDVLNIDKLLTLPQDKEEYKETVEEHVEDMYVYDDEVEEERINNNYELITELLLKKINEEGKLTLEKFCEYLKEKYADKILLNGDYYSMLVHMCQKNTYVVKEIIEKQETFFEKNICNVAKKNKELKDLAFIVEKDEKDRLIDVEGAASISFITFIKADTTKA